MSEGIGDNIFSNPSDGMKDVIDAASNILRQGTQSSLPSDLQRAAQDAGRFASAAKTVEDQQKIYKTALNKAANGRAFDTSTAQEFERIANQYKGKQ